MLRYAMLVVRSVVVRSVVGKVWHVVPFTCYCLSLMCLFMLSIHCLVSQSFSLSWDRKDAAKSEGSTTPTEDCKESFEEFSKQLDEDLKELCVKRMDSNGFVHSAGEDNSQVALPSKSGKSMKYFLSEKIGEGAYGKVYRSVDTITKEEVYYCF